MKRCVFVMAVMMLLAAGANAAVTVTNHAAEVDLLNVPDFVTGNAPGAAGTTERFGFDAGEYTGQEFTLDLAITLDSIYVGYSGYKDASTVTLYIDVDNDATTFAELDYSFVGLSVVGHVHDGSNDGPFSYFQFDLSAEGIALGAGTHAYVLEMTAEDGTSWAWAPSRNGSDTYAGGAAFGNPALTGDAHFAVTGVVPEPATLVLLGLGSLSLLRKRK